MNVYKKQWKITIFNGKIHYFNGHFQLLFVSLPGRVKDLMTPLQTWSWKWSNSTCQICQSCVQLWCDFFYPGHHAGADFFQPWTQCPACWWSRSLSRSISRFPVPCVVFILLLALLQLPCRVCLEFGDRRYRRCTPRPEVGPEVGLECFRQRKLTSFVTLEISEWFQGLTDFWAWTLGLCHTLSYFVHFGHFGSLKDGQWRVYHDNHSDCDAPWLPALHQPCIRHHPLSAPGGRRRPHQGQKPHRRQRQWPQPRLPQLQFRQPRLPPRPPGCKKTCLQWHH